MKCISLVFAILMMLCATQAFAQSFKTSTIEVDQPWIRATPKGAGSTAGYFRITNSGTTADRLTGGSSPIAGGIEIHEMSMTNGVMKMRPLPNGLEIKPGETVEVKPSSFHAMLVGLKQPVKQGDHIKGTLTFEKAGKVDIVYDVQAVGAPAPMQMPGGGMHMHH